LCIVVVLAMAFEAADDSASGVVSVSNAKVAEEQDRVIFGEDGAAIVVLFLRNSGGCFFNLSLRARSSSLCKNKGCAQSKSENH